MVHYLIQDSKGNVKKPLFHQPVFVGWKVGSCLRLNIYKTKMIHFPSLLFPVLFYVTSTLLVVLAKTLDPIFLLYAICSLPGKLMGPVYKIYPDQQLLTVALATTVV